MIVNDILLDDDFDLQISNGDFATGDSDEQHLQKITLLDQGQVRFSPLTGLAIARKLQSPLGLKQQDGLRRDVYVQLEMDGYNPNTANVTFGSEIEIKADR